MHSLSQLKASAEAVVSIESSLILRKDGQLELHVLVNEQELKLNEQAKQAE
jgi:hypothetical protein